MRHQSIDSVVLRKYLIEATEVSLANCRYVAISKQSSLPNWSKKDDGIHIIEVRDPCSYRWGDCFRLSEDLEKEKMSGVVPR